MTSCFFAKAVSREGLLALSLSLSVLSSFFFFFFFFRSDNFFRSLNACKHVCACASFLLVFMVYRALGLGVNILGWLLPSALATPLRPHSPSEVRSAFLRVHHEGLLSFRVMTVPFVRGGDVNHLVLDSCCRFFSADPRLNGFCVPGSGVMVWACAACMRERGLDNASGTVSSGTCGAHPFAGLVCRSTGGCTCCLLMGCTR